MLILENLCNWLPSICALVIWKETPFPLSVGCPIDGLPNISWQPCNVELPCYDFALLLSSTGDPDLPNSTLHLRVPHQARVETSLPDVRITCDP